MLTVDDIERAVRPYCAEQSIQTMRPKFERWVRFLTGAGIDRISSPHELDPTTVHKHAQAMNTLALLVRQATADRNSAIEHQLRNLTGIRPYKS